MAKRNRKAQEPTEEKGDAHEPPSVPVEALAGPWDGAAASAAEGVTTPAANDNPPGPAPTRAQKAVAKLRSVLGRYLPRKKVELIDDLNDGGLGIRLGFDDPAERPSEEVKQLLKEGDEQRPGFGYRGDLKQWRKRIGTDADPRAAVAIRLDAERRIEAVADRMGHEDRLKAERDAGGGVAGERHPGGPGPG
jgi:hypothetical protein